MMMMMMMAMMTNTIPYRRTKNHIWDKVLMGIWVHPIMVRMMMMAVMKMMLVTKVPSTTKPNFTVEEGVNIVPINGLSRLTRPWAR